MSTNEITLLRKDFLTLVSRVEMLEFEVAQLRPKSTDKKKEKGKEEKDIEEGYESDEEDEKPSLLVKKKGKKT